MGLHSDKWINEVADKLVQYSGGRIKIVEHEVDGTSDICDEAAKFLKFDGKRLGRDLKLYSFMAKVAGEPHMICTYLQEVLLPLGKVGLALSYREAAVVFRKWGGQIFDEERAKQWNELF